jgi:hypothetical protein
VIAIGIVLILTADVVVGITLHATDHGTTVSCGDPLSDLAHGDAVMTDSDNDLKYRMDGNGELTNFVDKCESKKTIFKLLGLALGILGLGLLVASVFIPGPQNRSGILKSVRQQEFPER